MCFFKNSDNYLQNLIKFIITEKIQISSSLCNLKAKYKCVLP